MINATIQWCTAFCKDTVQFNSIFGFIIYWVPLAICAIGFTLRTLANCAQEVKDRRAYEEGTISYFNPKETIGRIIGRAIVTVIPIANLGLAVFDFGETIIESVHRRVSSLNVNEQRIVDSL